MNLCGTDHLERGCVGRQISLWEINRCGMQSGDMRAHWAQKASCTDHKKQPAYTRNFPQKSFCRSVLGIYAGNTVCPDVTAHLVAEMNTTVVRFERLFTGEELVPLLKLPQVA